MKPSSGNKALERETSGSKISGTDWRLFQCFARFNDALTVHK
jgi:hypothetical protein